MAISKILTFALTDTGTNLLTDIEYSSDSQRIIGNQPGIARDKLNNKALRQASLMAAGLAAFIAANQVGDVADSLTATNISDYFTDAIKTVAPNIVFASGTRLLFAQATAPVGWTQDTTDAADNRMLRVVNTTGGGTGGSHSPILNNVVAAHTHGFSTGGPSENHTHSYATFTTETITVLAGPNVHTVISGAIIQTTGGFSNTHQHSGSTDNGSSQTNWTPRYNDLILCQKI